MLSGHSGSIRTFALPVLLVAAALALTACGGTSKDAGDSSSGVTVPKAGQCVAKEVKDGNDTAPDFTSVVPCTKPHVYEITSVVAIPKKFLDNTSTKASLARRTELARVGKKKSKATKQLDKHVWPKCDASVARTAGMARISPAASLLGPALHNTANWTTLTPPELWKQGVQKVVCSVRFEGDGSKPGKDTVRPVRSSSAKPVVSTYLTAGFPTRLHTCVVGTQIANCSKAHAVELLWNLNVDKVLGPATLDGQVTEPEIGRITAACTSAYKKLGQKVQPGAQMIYVSTPEQVQNGWVTCALGTTDASGHSAGPASLPPGFGSFGHPKGKTA